MRHKAINKHRKIIRSFIIVIAIGIGLYTFRETILDFPGHLLTIDDDPRKADAIILLNGSIVSRTQKAAQLYNAGVSPLILFTEEEDTPLVTIGLIPASASLTKLVLERHGVRSPAYELVDYTCTSTRDEAQALMRFIDHAYPTLETVVIVTDWYHTSRARWIFQRFNQRGLTIKMAAATMPHSSPKEWYRHEESFLQTFNEYLKWVYYLAKY